MTERRTENEKKREKERKIKRKNARKKRSVNGLVKRSMRKNGSVKSQMLNGKR